MATASARLRSAIKFPGGKYPQAPRICSFFPTHTFYVEPYCGSAAILLCKPKSPFEIINDVDPALMNFWEILRDHEPGLSSVIADVDYSAKQFYYSKNKVSAPADDTLASCIRWAAHFMIVNRMSRGGMMEDFAIPGAGPDRLRGGVQDNINAWNTIKADLPRIAARISGVALANKPAVRVIEAYRDDPAALIYADPSYLASTRTTKNVYRYEMSDDDHLALLDCIRDARAIIVLSGYPSDLYREGLPGWHYRDHATVNHAGQGPTKEGRVERLWCNRPLESWRSVASEVR